MAIWKEQIPPKKELVPMSPDPAPRKDPESRSDLPSATSDLPSPRRGPGTTRICPHCRTEILESAEVCPACRHHLRFEPGAARRSTPSFSPLKVEGTIRHPEVGESWEYSVLLSIRNDRGEEITRK